MPTGKIKTIKPTEKGGASIEMEDKSSYLCFKEDWQDSFKVGDMIEFEAVQKIGKTSGKPWFQMKGPHYPAPVNGAVTKGYVPTRSNDWSIFVTGVVGRAMGSGKFEAYDILKLTCHALEAWKHISNPTSSEELNDQVPF